MRWLVLATIVLTGCGPGLQFDKSAMNPDQMLNRATLVFAGLIERQTFVNWPFLRIPAEDSHYWRVLDRRVRVEAIARGEESRKVIDVYEIFWVGGTTGDWNLTQDGQRYLFLVRWENGRYHVVRDWWRSIYPIRSGIHDRFPLDSSRPLWERAALLQFWVGPGYAPAFPANSHLDPGRALGRWRLIKLLRGLLRHPDAKLRVAACESLLLWGTAQDECYDQLDSQSRTKPGQYWNGVVPAEEWSGNRRWERSEFALQSWERLRRSKGDRGNLDEMKLFTTVNDRELRERFCRLFLIEFPNDHDNGCPANQPPPATIVTENGDVPLLGEWPSNSNK